MAVKRKFIGRTIPRRAASGKSSASRKEKSEKSEQMQPVSTGESETVCGLDNPFASVEEDPFAAIDKDPFAALEQSSAPSDAAKEADDSEGEGATICGDASPFEEAPSEESAAASGESSESDDEGEGATICGDASPFDEDASAADVSADAAQEQSAEDASEGATVCGDVGDLPFADEPSAEAAAPAAEEEAEVEDEGATVCGLPSVEDFEALSEADDGQKQDAANDAKKGDEPPAGDLPFESAADADDEEEDEDAEAATQFLTAVGDFGDDDEDAESGHASSSESAASADEAGKAADTAGQNASGTSEKAGKGEDAAQAAQGAAAAQLFVPKISKGKSGSLRRSPLRPSASEKDKASESSRPAAAMTMEVSKPDVFAEAAAKPAPIPVGLRPTLEMPAVAAPPKAKVKTPEKDRATGEFPAVKAHPEGEGSAGMTLDLFPSAAASAEGGDAKPPADSTALALAPTSESAKNRPTMEIPAVTVDSSAGKKAHALPGGATKSGEMRAVTKSGSRTKTGETKAVTKSGVTKSGVTKSGVTKDGTGKGKKNSFVFQPGDMVNHYELIRLLGKGGMGSVFLARDTKLGRRVAIKFLHTKDKDLGRRFILEARTTARVGHENIVIIYEADEFNGMPYMVLEYLQGSELTKLLTNQPMPPGRVAELMVPVLRALVRAHSEGIVHRDLKPDNVMLTDSGTVKVMDFGISKVLEGDDKGDSDKADKDSAKKGDDKSLANDSSGMTRAGAIVGTLAYMSPEQWRAKGIDHRTDLWAAGIMLFRMLSGKHPLEGLSGMQLAIVGDYKHKMPSLRDVMPQLPNDLIDLVDKALQKRKEQRWEDAASMLEALEAFLPGRARKLKVDQSPYAGLSAFQEADADRFFGRNNEIAAVVNRLRDQALLGIVGASGSGKSSIVRAGVLPALKRSGENWECLVIRPGRSPIHALAEVLSPMSASLAISKDDALAMGNLEERIRKEPGYAGSLLRNRARQSKCNQLLFIDQFEELYTQVGDLDERLAFTAALTSIADDPSSPTRVILSIRSDFLDRVAEDMVFMNELSQGLIFLIAPNRNGLRDAIVQPAEMAGFTFESEDIVNEMLDHLASTPGALPLLQFAASKLWDSRDVSRKMLTVAGYRALGGIAGALATHADAVLNEMPSSSQDLARAIFLRLITPERTRAIVSMSELDELSHDADELKRVVNQLVQARLLVVQTSGGNSTVEIVHESLVHTWPTLKRWLDETGEDAPFLEALRNATKQWQFKNYDKDQLWRGKQADEAERFMEKGKLAGIPDAQLDYLDAVIAQKKRAARNKRLAQIIGGTFLVCLAVGSTLFAGYAFQLQKEAQESAEVAKIEKQNAEKQTKVANEAKAQVEGLLTEATEARKKAESAQKEAEAAEQKAVASQKEAEASKEEAEKALKVAQQKEKERSIAEARARQAAADLALKNKDLAKTLKMAEAARIAARNAQKGAERNAQLARRQEQVARQAEEKALKAAQEVAALLLQEQERVQRLQDQLGSPVIDDLK